MVSILRVLYNSVELVGNVELKASMEDQMGDFPKGKSLGV